LTTTTTRRLRLDRNQLAKALNGDPEVVRQFELLLSLVNAIEPGGGTGAVDSVNGQTGVVVLDAGDVGADSAGTAATATAALAATLADIATSGSADDLVAGTVPVARLPLTTVTPGSYTSTNLTVDATGRITAASNGSGGGGGTFGSATATFTVGLDSVTISVVDAGVSATSNIVLSVGTATGREPDEFVFAPVFPVVASVTAGVGFDILVTCPDADADGAYLINYTRD
jgi:hypothetical protein